MTNKIYAIIEHHTGDDEIEDTYSVRNPIFLTMEDAEKFLLLYRREYYIQNHIYHIGFYKGDSDTSKRDDWAKKHFNFSSYEDFMKYQRSRSVSWQAAKERISSLKDEDIDEIVGLTVSSVFDIREYDIHHPFA